MTHGIDTTQFDPSIRVQDDLFRHVHGPWLRDAEIKPDRATAGSFVTLVDEAEAKVLAIIESASEAPEDDEQRKIGDLYASFMDEDRIEALGAAPLASELAQVDAIGDIAGFVATLGTLDRQGVGSVFGMYIGPDSGQPDRYVTHLGQGGIGLPDEAYYREDESAAIREAYVAHLTTMLGLSGLDDAAGRALRIMDLETRIAAFHWDRVESRDAQKTYNLLTLDGVRDLAPSFDWAAWSEAAQIPAPVIAELVVAQPSYLEGLETLLVDAELDAWKDWLRWQVVHSASPYLSSPFVAANFEFYGRTLSGTDELRPRWKRGVGFVEASVGEAVGRIYVRTEFPPASKARMTELIDNLLEAYRQSISELPWMSDETKQKAYDKLDTFNPKIGHPDEFRDYSALQLTADDLLGNVAAASAFETDRELGKIGSPVDRDEWFMLPQTVNAYYNPGNNEICFPAAVLQPPFFSPDAEQAENYGGIGSVIGHEIGHGFDDQGAQYDGTGNLNDWWTPEDKAAFELKSKALIEQYDGFEPRNLPGEHVNGALTVGENIGDLGGLTISHTAYLIAQGGAAPVEERRKVFLNYANIWRTKRRKEQDLQYLTIDPHSPPEFRANIVRNLDEFHEAFETADGDGLWLDPADRVRIW